MKKSLCLTAAGVSLLSLLPIASHANPNPVAYASTHMTAFSSNAGLLAQEKYMTYTENGVTGSVADTISLSATPGHSKSLAGSTHARLTNDTGLTITIQNPSPTISVKAYGETLGDPATATSTISLGSATSTGSCTGIDGTYTDPETVTFAVSDLADGDYVDKSGSFSILVNGG